MPSIDFKSGLVSSAASSLGTFASGAYSTAIKPALDMAKSYANTTFSPAEEPGGNWVNDMAMGLLQAHKNQFSKAAQSYDQGNYTESAGHALAGAVPFVGPAAAATGETIGRGEYAKGLGEAAGLIGGALIGKGKAVTRASRVGRVAEEGALVSKVAEDAPRPLPDWAREAGPTPSRVSIRQGPPMTTAELDAKYAAKTGEPRSFLDPDSYTTPQDSTGLKAASEGTRVNQALDAVNRVEASAKLRNKPAPPAAERPTIAEDEPPATISKVESDRAANAYMRRGFGLRPTEPGPEVQVNPPARESLSSLADESAESYTNRLAKQVGPSKVQWIDQAVGKKATAADVRDAARGALWRDYGVREMENKPGAPSGVQPETSIPGLTDPETTTTAQNYLNALGNKSDMLKLKKMEDAINSSSMSERAKIDEIERLREDAGFFKPPHKPIKIEEMPQDFSKQAPGSIKNKNITPPAEGPLLGGPGLPKDPLSGTETYATGGGGKDFTHLYFPEHKALVPIEELKKEVEAQGLTKPDAEVHAAVEQLLQNHPEYKERFSPEQLELNIRYGGQPINANNVTAHEAGHVVVGNKIGLPIKEVSTFPQMLGGGRFSQGQTKTGTIKSILSMNLHPEEHSVFTMAGKAGEEHSGLVPDPKMALSDIETVKQQLAKRAGRDPEELVNEGQAKAKDLLNGELAEQHTKLTDFLRENYGKTLQYGEFKHLLKTIAPPIGLAAVQQLWSNYSEAKDRGPSKTDIKPYDPEKMKFDIVTADDKGTPRYLPPEQDKMVKNLINSMAPEQVPTGGLIFVPENKYKDIQKQINHGTLFGKKITTQNEENFAPGADSLGDGFSLPAYRRTYLNAALLNNPKKLEYVLAHELGHNAAWLSKQNKPDFSETGADEFKDAYLKRGQMTRKNWDAIQHLHGALMGE